MKRRVGAVGLLALGCSLFTTESEAPPLLTSLPRSLTSAESELVTASNQFGFDLLRQARAGAPNSNVFLSPVSAAMALGMTLNGAAGLTLDSMRLALRLGSTALPDINASYRSLIDLLRGLDGTNEFQLANSIWADAGIPWRPEFLAAGHTWFDAEIQSLDLQAPASLGVINDWVKQKTNGAIPSILDQVSTDEVMFLINAIYFKGKWRIAFDPKRTSPGTFHPAGEPAQTVPMMSREADTLRYAFTSDLELIELLYGNGGFAMTIVLPSPNRSLADVTSGLDATRWADWIAGLHEAKMGLVMPKFRLEYKRELKDDLSALGMRRAFDDRLADFSNMAVLSQAGLFLSRVTQKTFVDVNEEGTVAAAATSVGVATTSAPTTVVLDRPFLFAIRERFSGTVLFLGQITRIP